MDGILTKYSCRDEEVRATVSKDEAIRRIRNYGAEYDPTTSSFDVYDQLLACESIAESTQVKTNRIKNYVYEPVNGTGGAYGGCNHNAIADLYLQKKEIISQLHSCNYRTPLVQLTDLLENLFSDYPTNKPGYWFDVARYYPPKAINSALKELQKLSSPSHQTVRNPAAYFTFLIKSRKQRAQRRKEVKNGIR